MHDKNVLQGVATEYKFFANETWFCIKALLLAHVGAILLFCIDMKVSINPRVMNTDKVEHFSGDDRQFIGGSTEKMSARGLRYAAARLTACNNGRHNVHGNNKTAKHLNRQKRF